MGRRLNSAIAFDVHDQEHFIYEARNSTSQLRTPTFLLARALTRVCLPRDDPDSFLRSVQRSGQGIEPEDVILFDKETIEFAVDSSFRSELFIKNTSGKENLDSIRRDAIADVDAIIACFSLIDSRTLDSLGKKWIPEIRQILGQDIPIVLVGTKLDAREALVSETSKRTSKRLVPVESKEGEALAKKLKLNAFFQTSARLGTSVKEAVVETLRHATLYKIKQENARAAFSNGSQAASPRLSIFKKLLSPGRSSTKLRLSKRLLEVASEGDTQVALELLSKGAHASWSSAETKSSPLHAAAKSGNVDMLNILMYAGADLTLRDANGATALHIACCNGHYECAKALLDRGADINATNLVNSTPLHDAAGSGSRELVLLLLERGANESLKDIGGHTANERAVHSGYPMLFAEVGLEHPSQ